MANLLVCQTPYTYIGLYYGKPLSLSNPIYIIIIIIIIIIILYCTTLAKRRLLRRVRVKNRGWECSCVRGCVHVRVRVCVCASAYAYVWVHLYAR